MNVERGLVVPSIDYVKGVFYNVDFNFVIHDFLGIDNFPLDDPAMVASTEWKTNYDKNLGFSYNGVTVTANALDVISERVDTNDRKSFFNHVFSNVGFDISGTGCRFLRKINPDFDNYIRDFSQYDDLGKQLFHFTRIDFAFDFFNYKPEFFESFFNFLVDLDKNHFSSVPVTSSTKPLKFEIQLGDRRSAYIGAKRSGKYLNVYDKLLERGGLFPEDLPFTDEEFSQNASLIDSWYRIELRTSDDKQGRKKHLRSVLYGCPDPLQRLRYIYDVFAFCDSDRYVLDFWNQFWDWESISPIIQNLHFNKVVLTRDKVLKQYQNWIKQGRVFLSYFGLDQICDDFANSFYDMVVQGEFSYSYHRYLERLCILNNAPFDENNNVIKDKKYISDIPFVRPVVSATSGKLFYVSELIDRVYFK